MADEEQNTRPAFWAPIKAAGRQGAKELAQILPAFPESVRPVEEPGTLGNPTPQEITNERKASIDSSHEQLLNFYGKSNAHSADRDRDLGMER